MPPKHLILCWPFSSCPRCFPTSWPLPTCWLITLGGASASASVLPMNIKGWYPMDWLEWSLEIQGALKSLLKHSSLKASIFSAQPSLWSNSHIYTWLYGHLSTKWCLCIYSLDYKVVLFLTFWGTSMLFSTAWISMNFRSHQQCTSVPSSLYLCQHAICCLFDKSILTGVRRHLFVTFLYGDVEHLCICLLSIYMSSLGKCLFRFSVYFLFGLFAFWS